MKNLLKATIALTAFAALAACSETGAQIQVPDSVVQSCKAEAGISGDVAVTYWNEGYGDIPRIAPGLNATDYQAEVANSCISLFASNSYTNSVSRHSRFWNSLILPSGYPLLPGDIELWLTLTPEQQARALLFLQDGSTIRSSLEAD